MKLVVDNLTCRRGDLRVLAGVCFEVAAGRALVLRGPNGSGKTTLLRILAGLAPAEAGQISASADDIAYAGHADGLKGQLSVAGNLRFWAGVFGHGGIDSALAAFNLQSLSDRPAHTLSAGQKRRLGLARLMVTGRGIWLLDEPTVSLDATHVAMFADVLRRHLAAGGSAVVATHIDLGLDDADSLDVTRFAAGDDSATANPFLDEALA